MTRVLVRLGQRWTLVLPKELRQGLDQHALFEVERREDGVIELRPQVTIDAAQSWFWTKQWQQMEREADEDFATGRYQTYRDADSFLEGLDAESDDRAG